MEQSSRLLGVSGTSKLRFISTQHSKDGGLTIEFTVSPASKIRRFDFGSFEGPGAPAGQEKLMRITVVQGEKRSQFQISQAGWWSADVKDGFTFGAFTPTNDKHGDVRKVLEKILAGAESIEIAIIDYTDPKKILFATFPIASDRQNFQKLMESARK